MIRRGLLALAWLLAASAAWPQAAPGELAVGIADRYALSRSFMFLEDTRGDLAFDDVLKPSAQAAFRSVALSGPGANFGLTASAIWLRVTLKAQPDAPRDWLLEVAYPPWTDLDLYVRRRVPATRWRGTSSPFATRAIMHRNHVLPVRLAPGESHALPADAVGGHRVRAGDAVANRGAVATRPARLCGARASTSDC